ncbi:MAG TPA: D-aminoacylase, partial [Bryobacteraceae bacterium]
MPSRRVVLGLPLCGLLLLPLLEPQQPTASTLITGATIADGTGSPLRDGDVRVTGDRIAELGKLSPRTGERVIDGRGLVLAPGFIDLHNHSTAIDKEPVATTQVSQGLTTILVGQDGSSPWPIKDYLEDRRAHPAALNLQVMAGHATIRRKVMGDDYKRVATAEEIAAMAKLVDAAMSEGAVGLSSGLEYEVGSYSNSPELIEMARAAGARRGIYLSHVRDEGDHVMDSFNEVIRIAEQGRLPVGISHIKLGTEAVWGKSKQVVDLVNRARARGVKIEADCYPYEAWSSTIAVLVLDKQYDNPVSVGKGLADVGGAANVTITRCAKHPDFEGKTLEEVARANEMTPVAMYSKIIRDGGAGIVCHAMKEDDIRTFYQQPWVAVASDGGIGMQHPRGAGTFPRVLGVYVRERHWLTLEEAIRKMTSLPAARLKLKDRGQIRVGAYADLVLFNAKTVKDNSTFAEPQKIATGIEKVFVNGTLVWDGGKTTGALPGRVV